MIHNLLADQTGDNATCLVREILKQGAATMEHVGYITQASVYVSPKTYSEREAKMYGWRKVFAPKEPQK
jgi:hypothetical protein